MIDIKSTFKKYKPRYSNRSDAIKDRTLSDTTSPIEAANGVAKLSGFIRNLRDNNITATKTKSVKVVKQNKIKDGSFEKKTTQS